MNRSDTSIGEVSSIQPHRVMWASAGSNHDRVFFRAIQLFSHVHFCCSYIRRHTHNWVCSWNFHRLKCPHSLLGNSTSNSIIEQCQCHTFGLVNGNWLLLFECASMQIFENIEELISWNEWQLAFFFPDVSHSFIVALLHACNIHCLLRDKIEYIFAWRS